MATASSSRTPEALWAAPPPALREVDLRFGWRTPAVHETIRARQVPPEALPASNTPQRVEHVKFGAGTVTAIDGDTVHVAFEMGGDKKIKRRFLTFVDDAVVGEASVFEPPRLRIVV